MLRKILNKIYCNQYNKRDLFLEYSKKIKSENNEMVANRNILVTPIDARFIHTWEGLFSKKAALNGYKVHTLLCGHGLNHCDYLSKYVSFPKARCTVCQEWAREYLDAFGTEPIFIKDKITNVEKGRIDQYVEEYFKTPSKMHTFLDVNVDELLRSGLQRYYLMANPEIKNEVVERSVLATILKVLIAMDKICQEIKPEIVLSSHGVYSTWGPVIEYCKVHHIFCVTYGRSYNKNGITFAYNNSYLKRDLDDREDAWRQRKLTKEQRGRVIKFFKERTGLSDGTIEYDYYGDNKKILTSVQIKEMLGIPPKKKIVGLFPNIPWDGQVSGEGDVFPQYQDWLKTTLDFFVERKDIYLILRTHPAESLKGYAVGDENLESMVNEIYPVLPPNIILLPYAHPINSYSLGLSSNFGIAYCSTICMELTFLGVPVIVAGYPEFGKKGIMYDITSIDNYIELLEKGIGEELCVDEQAKEDLIKFAHYFFFETIMPETLLVLAGEETEGYKFKTESELDRDKVFEHMFRGIERKEALDFSSYYE